MITWLVGWALACEAVVGALVHTPDGPREGWDVAWQDGRITAVGPGVGAGCTPITVRAQGTGAPVARPQVTAGLVATDTQVGLVEVRLESATHDDAGDGDPVRAALRVVDGYNPHSVVIPVTRVGGVTSAVVTPTGGFVAGQAGAVRLAGATQAEAVTASSVAVVLDLGAAGGSAAGLLRLRELLADVRAFVARGRTPEVADVLSASRADLEALVPVVDGKVPLLVHADRASDIEALARFAGEAKVRLVIAGAAEGWMVADQLAAARIGVIIDPFVYGAGSFDQVHGRADNGALLVSRGVQVAIRADGDAHNVRSLRFVAGNAVRGGMRHADALAAITRVPAELFGLAGRGRVEVGAFADLVVWTGDPLDVTGRVAAVVIGGRGVPLTSRQTELVDAWRTVPRPYGR